MRMCRVATAALVFLLVSGVTEARTLDQVPPYLKKEGNFVAYPAIAMGGLGMLVGGIIALPASLIAAPIGWAAGDPLGYAMVPMSLLATGGGEIGYHVGGAIPWVLKNGLYDAPMEGIARIKGEPPSGLVAQVDPPPRVTNGDLQYLESTPVDARIPVVLSRQYSAALPPPKEPTSLMLRRQMSPFKPPVMPSGFRPATGAGVASQASPPSPQVPAASMPAPRPPVVPEARASQPASAPTPSTAREEPAEASEPTDDRPALKKKKRKFSERFGF